MSKIPFGLSDNYKNEILRSSFGCKRIFATIKNMLNRSFLGKFIWIQAHQISETVIGPFNTDFKNKTVSVSMDDNLKISKSNSPLHSTIIDSPSGIIVYTFKFLIQAKRGKETAYFIPNNGPRLKTCANHEMKKGNTGI